MKKPGVLLLLLCGIVVLVAAAIFFLLHNLDALVKTAIEKYGSEAAGTTVRVRSVTIELKAGRGTVRGLTVANPAGFSKEPIFTLGEVVLDLNPGSLDSDLPIVEEIRIGAPKLLYEVNQNARTNLAALQKNLASYSAGRKKAEPSAGKKDALRLLVRRLTVAEGQGTLDLTAIGGKRLEAHLPPITLTDLGGRQGITPANLAEVILAALVKNLEQTAAREGVEGEIRSRLSKEAGDLQQKLEKKLGPDAGDALKKMLGQ